MPVFIPLSLQGASGILLKGQIMSHHCPGPSTTFQRMQNKIHRQSPTTVVPEAMHPLEIPGEFVDNVMPGQTPDQQNQKLWGWGSSRIAR